MHATQQQPVWQAPPPTPKPEPIEHPANGYGIAALVLGIISFVMGFTTIELGAAFGTPVAIAGIALGVLGLRRISHREADNKAMTIIGLVLAVVGLAISIDAIYLWITLTT